MRANFSLSGLHFIFLSTTKKVLVVKIIGTWYSETTQKGDSHGPKKKKKKKKDEQTEGW